MEIMVEGATINIKDGMKRIEAFGSCQKNIRGDYIEKYITGHDFSLLVIRL